MSYYWKVIIVLSIPDTVNCISNAFRAHYLIILSGSFGYCLWLISSRCVIMNNFLLSGMSELQAQLPVWARSWLGQMCRKIAGEEDDFPVVHSWHCSQSWRLSKKLPSKKKMGRLSNSWWNASVTHSAHSGLCTWQKQVFFIPEYNFDTP